MLGAGAVVPQTLTVINKAVSGGELATNEVVRTALTASERVHLLGMVSDGGVHSGFEHLHALIALAGRLDVPDLVLHCFADGRDTPADGGRGLSEHSLGLVPGWGAGRVTGRYYAMDRDRRWERAQAAYDLLVHGRGEHTLPNALAAAQAAYRRGETDEFMIPTVVGSEGRIRRRQRAVLQLSPGPDARDRARVARARLRRGHRGSPRVERAWRHVSGATARDHHRVSARLAVSGGVPLSARGRPTRRGSGPGRREPAARGRDREVRGRSSPGRGARARHDRRDTATAAGQPM